MVGSGPVRSSRAEIGQAVARTPLFISSFAPLFLILAVRFDTPWLRLLCGVLFGLGVVSVVLILRSAQKNSMRFPVAVSHVTDLGGEVGGYLASYLLPFVTVPSPDAQDLVGYGIFFLVAWLVYVRSDLVQINPTFYALGYRILRAHLSTGSQVYLLSRLTPLRDDKIQVVDAVGILVRVGSPDA